MWGDLSSERINGAGAGMDPPRVDSVGPKAVPIW